MNHEPLTKLSNRKLNILLSVLLLLLTSCVDQEEYNDDTRGNFEALWHIMDEHYCFFDEKNVDWNAVHSRYAPQAAGSLSRQQLFDLLSAMLSELRDGHVNLYAPFDMGRYWAWHEDYPKNFSDTLQRRYLGTDYKIAGTVRYRTLDDNVGYVYIGSFQTEPGDGNLDEVLINLAPCRALIVDVRNNGGGQLTAAEQLAARFTNEERLVGYMQHKAGRGHNDFSKMEEQRLKPSKGVRWQKRVAVLTNRSVYSAANEFVKYMKQCPHVVVVGDQTGGGAGLPFSSELPNGWGVRFSACPMYDINKQPTEFGIQPDIHIEIDQDDLLRRYDTIIETARRQI